MTNYYQPTLFEGNPATCPSIGPQGDSICRNSGTGSTLCGRPGLLKSSKSQLTCCPDSHRSGGTCTNLPDQSFCDGDSICLGGACGHPGELDIGKICCPSGQAYTNSGFHRFCSGAPIDAPCFLERGVLRNAGCASGLACGHPGSQTEQPICCPNGTFEGANAITYCALQSNGSICTDDRACESGNCDGGTCSSIPKEEQNIGIIFIVILIIVFFIFIIWLISRFFRS